MKKLVTLLSLLIGAVCSFAQTFMVGDIEYSVLSSTNKTAQVFDGQNATGDVVIPETITYNDVEYRVTKIKSNAFYQNIKITSIDMPSVTTIEFNAFNGCSLLSSISIPSVTYIGSTGFSGCSKISSLRIGSIEQWCKVNFDGVSSNPLSGTSQSVNLYIGDSDTPATDIEFHSTITNIPNYAFRKTTITSISASAAESIGSSAFQNCTSLSSVSLPAAESIGSSAFMYCTSLSSVSLPAANSFGKYAFYECSEISSLRIGSVEQWCNVTFDGSASSPLGYEYTALPVNLYIGDSETPVTEIEIPEHVRTIPAYAFQKTTITSVSALGAETIGSSAFYRCKSLSSVSFSSSLSSIKSNAFTQCSTLSEIVFAGASPASATSCFDSQTSLVVPDAAYEDYKTAWPSYANQITIAGQREREVNVVARDEESALHRALGEENLRHILKLKVSGSINGYDIMLLRNKMINIHHLDLSDATIVGNDYEYYTGCHTTDNEIGPNAFVGLTNLFSVKLPEVTAIRSSAFASCRNLCEINLPESLTTLSSSAFYNCTSLTSVEIPGSVATIGSSAFYGCANLKEVTLHEGLENISSYAFTGCAIKEIRFPESLKAIESYALSSGSVSMYGYNMFEEINLPPNLNTIGQYAFQDCLSLKVVRLNPMLQNISNYAFSGCNALKKVYTYTLEPTDILQNTFSTYKAADLYVPTPSYYTYYYNTQWSQFLSVNKTDEEYDFKSFYINKDYVMDDETGILGGDPDAELNDNSGLVNNGSETQELGTVTMRFNGNNGSASIIANGNLTADKIKVEITVTGNKWHFFCFPFDVPLSGVSTSGNKAFVFRHYNAEKRATGASGWEDLAADQTTLKAGEGYIFQANGNTTLTVEVDNKTTFVGENVATALKVQDAANVANASWNFKGNPGYAYFDIDDLGFSAPITVWDPNTNTYVALRPGDDDAFLHPFQAFFVQKPEGTDALTFNAADRTTYLESQKAMNKKKKARRAAAASMANNPRKLINLNVTDGENSDMTRVVFNDEKSMAYEIDCDAAKFNAAGVPQIYSIGADNTHFAINERPNDNGIVRLGFVADKAGIFTIEASRMDTPCCLKDLQTGVIYELKDGAYQFESAQGTFENRFLLITTDAATGIETVEQGSIPADAVIYDIQGRKVQRAEHGIFVVNGKKVNVK